MKATLDLPEDIYQAAKSLADRKKISLGAAVTELARHGRALLIEAEPSNRSAMTSGFQQHELSQALTGDTTALDRLMGVLMPIIRARVARGLLLRCQGGNAGRDVRQEIDDLTQEVFLTLFADGGRVLRSWQPERGLTLEAFVGLVTERRVLSILRLGKRSPSREDPTLPAAEFDGIADDQDPEAQAASREQLRLLLDRLTEELSPLGRRLFQLLFLEELPIEAAARQTGLSPDAVYAWRSRLRRLSRRLLAEMSLVELPRSSPPDRSRRDTLQSGPAARQKSPILSPRSTSGGSNPASRAEFDEPLEVGIQIASLNDQIWELIVAHGNDPGLPALVAPLREQVRALQREEAEVVRRNFQAQLQFDAEAGMRFIEETERLWKGR